MTRTSVMLVGFVLIGAVAGADAQSPANDAFSVRSLCRTTSTTPLPSEFELTFGGDTSATHVEIRAIGERVKFGQLSSEKQPMVMALPSAPNTKRNTLMVMASYKDGDQHYSTVTKYERDGANVVGVRTSLSTESKQAASASADYDCVVQPSSTPAERG